MIRRFGEVYIQHRNSFLDLSPTGLQERTRQKQEASQTRKQADDHDILLMERGPRSYQRFSQLRESFFHLAVYEFQGKMRQHHGWEKDVSREPTAASLDIGEGRPER